MMSIRIWNLSINPIYLLIVGYLVGILMRLLVRAGSAFRSQVNLYPTRRSFIEKNWDIFAGRTFVISIFFFWWLNDPGAWSRGLIAIGITPGIANWLTFPPTLTTAPAFGFLGDVGLDQLQIRLADRYPWLPKILKGEIPSYDPTVVVVDKLSKDRKVGG